MYRRLAQTASAARSELRKVWLCLAWPPGHAFFWCRLGKAAAGSIEALALVQRPTVGASPGSPSTLEGSKKKLPSSFTVIDLNPLASGAIPSLPLFSW